ncbi:MAG: hypothetical protein P4M12_02710 [Gammaproteobacteria bacterium]|nr:hypothetical protein [Gammaproteobacteria bacterium]
MNNNFEIKTKSATQLIIIHLLLCTIGLLGSTFDILYLWAKRAAEKISVFLPYTSWAHMTLAKNKTSFMAGYVGCVIVLFLYSIFAMMIFNLVARMKDNSKIVVFNKKESYLLYALAVFIANTVLFYEFMHFRSVTFWALLTLAWLIILCVPFYKIFNVIAEKIYLHLPAKLISYVLIVIALALFVFAISPYLKGSQLQVSNDFLWVPESTLINGKYVDNNSYIMANGIGGLFSNHSVKSSSDLNLAEYNTVKVNAPGAEIASNLFFNKKLNLLFIKPEAIAKGANVSLCFLVDAQACRDIQTFTPKLQPSYTPDVLQFIQKNSYELSNEVIAGHYFHHHFAMMGPLNEVLLGKPSTNIIYLYGLGNTLVVMNLLHHFTSGYSFENYIMVLYSFYPLYYLFLVLTCAVIFRNVRYVSFVSVFSISLIFLMGFELVRLAPGYNPLRHLLDLPLILLLYGYLQSKKEDFLYLISACLITLFAIIANVEFGLMMLGALIATVALHVLLSTKKYANLLVVAITILVSGLVLHVIGEHTGKGMMGLYSILGVSVSPMFKPTILILLALVASGYIGLFLIAYKKGLKQPALYILMFLFFYTQCLLLYYVWYTELGHLAATSPIWLMCFFLFYKEILSCIDKDKIVESYSMIVLYAASIILLSFSSYRYFHQQHLYQSIFRDHKVYQWDFDKAHFQSSMNPSVFHEAANLINQFNPSNTIYIISKYDDILPLLANKYSAMPYLELATSLVTSNEIKNSADAILLGKPKYIFVDSDINDTHVGDIIDNSNPSRSQLGAYDPFNVMYDKERLSYGRVLVIKELKSVFDRVSSDYKLIAEGYLISVYERK